MGKRKSVEIEDVPVSELESNNSPFVTTYLRPLEKEQIPFWTITEDDPPLLLKDSKNILYHVNRRVENHTDVQNWISINGTDALPFYPKAWLDLHLVQSTSDIDECCLAFLLGTQHQLYIELAVLAGNLYRLFMGEQQPKYYSAKKDIFDTSGRDSNCFRLSSHIDELNEEDVVSVHSNAFILENLFVANTEPPEEPPVIGFFMQMVFSYFLGDEDVKNFGAIPDKDILRVIRFDPETAFDDFFWCCNLFRHIHYYLKYISGYKLDEKDIYVEPERFFDFNEFINDDDKDDSIPTIDNNPWRTFEVYAAIARIIEIPFERYEELIDKNISPEFAKQISLLKDTFQKRLELFRKVAFQLEDFPKFYEAFKGDTDIGNFWRHFYGSTRIQPKATANKVNNNNIVDHSDNYMPRLYKYQVEALERKKQAEALEKKRQDEEEQRRTKRLEEEMKKYLSVSNRYTMFSSNQEDLSQKGSNPQYKKFKYGSNLTN